MHSLIFRPKINIKDLAVVTGFNMNTKRAAKTDFIASAIVSITRHPKYNAEKGFDDIALLTLRRPISKKAFNGHLKAAELPWFQPQPENKECVVLGWGSTIQMGASYKLNIEK